MDIEVGGRAKALDEGHRAGVGFGAFESRLFNQKCRYGPVDDLQDRREERGMCSEQQAQRDRKREHPLAHWHPGDGVIDQVGGRLRHAPGTAGGTKATPLTGEGYDSILKFLALDFFDYPIINGLTELHEP